MRFLPAAFPIAALPVILAIVVLPVAALAQQPASSPPGAADPGEATILLRGQVEALRASTDAQNKIAPSLDSVVNRLERLEAATRTLPPALDGLKTDLVAIRTAVEKLSGSNGIKRPAATLKFGPFACGNETEASCGANACKSVGYRGGIVVSAQRNGTPPNTTTVGINEATCYD